MGGCTSGVWLEPVACTVVSWLLLCVGSGTDSVSWCLIAQWPAGLGPSALQRIMQIKHTSLYARAPGRTFWKREFLEVRAHYQADGVQLVQSVLKLAVVLLELTTGKMDVEPVLSSPAIFFFPLGSLFP